MPRKEKLRVEVQTLDDPIQLGQPIYRLKRAASINLDFEENNVGEGGFHSPIEEKPFRLFTRALSAECPKRGCLHELALAEPRVP
uniref:Ferredoxin n=1 Tax=Meloidogyne hapla TaxID=6305 RepID=A0A1I8B9J9_MELHA